MFSGIVTALVKPISRDIQKTSIKLTLPIQKGWKIKKGDSVSVDGICSTVEKTDSKTFSVHYMEETLKKTSLLNLPEGHEYNLEQPLTLNDFLGGHLVSGHIDTVGTVTKIDKKIDSTVVAFSVPKEFTKYLIYKGSVAINGVSLTVVSIEKDELVVSLIPYTLSHTNLGALKVNDTVNIEFDLLAKYLERLLKK